jgi:hypothetical protein
MVAATGSADAAPVSLIGNACGDGWSFVVARGATYSSNTLQGITIADVYINVLIQGTASAPTLEGNQNGNNGWILNLTIPEGQGAGAVAAIPPRKKIFFEIQFEPFASGSKHTINRLVLRNTTGDC